MTEDPSQTYMLLNGTAGPDTSMLVPSDLSPFSVPDLPKVSTNKTKLTERFLVNQTGTGTWEMSDKPYVQSNLPVIDGKNSSGWNALTTKRLLANVAVDIIVESANDSLSEMGHPIHLHGHKFWILGSGSGSFPYNTVADAPNNIIAFENIPYRDVALLPPSGWLVLRYEANNPGAWMLRCQAQWPLLGGMAAVMVEDEKQLETMVHHAGPSTAEGNVAPMLPPSSNPTPSSTPTLKSMASVTIRPVFRELILPVFVAALLLKLLDR